MRLDYRTIIGFSLLTLCLGAFWLFSVWDYATLHYSLTYEVETPDGVKSGSSVVGVRREDTTRLPFPNTGYGYHIKGEAVVIDLGKGKFLFSLLQENAYALPSAVFENIRPSGMGVIEFTEWLTKEKPNGFVSADNIPLLVTFEDISDPMSLTEVKPNDLTTAFGPGYALKSITLTITDAAITNGRIETVLDWLTELAGGYLGGGFTSRDAPLGLDGAAFLKN